MTEYNLLSLNVRGLRNKSKRLQMFQWLKEYHNGHNCFIFLQETHSTILDETVWQREWGSKIIFSHGSSKSCGVAIMFPLKFNIEVVKIASNIEGRKLCIELKNDNESLALLNIYAPTKDKVKEHVEFINSLRNELEMFSEKLIIGGDMNLYLNYNLDKDNTQSPNVKASAELQNVLNDFEYVDIWRILNPTTKRYTWSRRRPLVQSRLDYWCIPHEMIFAVESCSIKPSIKTDHKLISLKLNFNKTDKRGPGLWKFNSQLLHNQEFITKIKSVVREDYGIENKSLKWEFIKMKIREFSTAFAKRLAKESREKKIQLSNELDVCSANVDTDPSEDNIIKLQMAQSKLEQLNEIETRGVILRSKAQWVEQGEKNTKYFLSVEKRNYKAKHIIKLKVGDNKYVTNPKDILQVQKDFYEKLYCNSERTEDFDSLFLTNLPKLSNQNITITENELTIAEVSMSVKNMKKGKSPGSDGLSTDFYKFFWSDISNLVFDSLNAAFENMLMSEEQRRAVLRLIPKKDKDITDLKNWRPISLLNTDYKILAHTLAGRLQHVLPEIISKDQNAYIKNRFIGYNIRTILDVIENSNSKHLKNIIAFLDFEKAFDKLNWTFIQKSLTAFGFGPKFMKWVTIMYTNISSCVINNGHTTQYFTLACGIRQGCPLSALLFIIAAETLAISIRKNDNIKGVTFSQHEVKLCQLADDTTLFLADIQSLQIALNILFMFYKSSGLKLNYSKTEILNLGHQYGNKENPFNLKWVKERVYALGTWFYKDMDTCVNINYESRFSSFKSILKTWRVRHLTFYGKITVIKSLALSKLNYCIMTMQTPLWFVNAVQEEINNFLWDDKPPKIKYKTVISSYEKGGLKLTDIDCYVKAQKAIWVKRLNDMQQPCSQYLQEFLDGMTVSDLLMCNMDPEEIPFTVPFFYRQSLHAWFTLKNLSEVKLENVVIWNNIKIRIDGNTVFYKKWNEHGVFFLSDLFKSPGILLSYDEFKLKYAIKCHRLQYMGLIDALPKSWRCAQVQVSDDGYRQNFLFGTILSKVTSKMIYTKLIENLEKEATCVNSWKKDYAIHYSKDEWKVIFTLSKQITACTILQEMQLKICHRIYATDSYVNNFDKTVKQNCEVCKMKNNIKHCFFECQLLQHFLKFLDNWIRHNFNPQFQLDVQTMLFGEIDEKSFIVNYCLLHAKWYIHKTRKTHNNTQMLYFSFTCFLQHLNWSILVEKEIASNKMKTSEFDVKFNMLQNVL